MLLKVGVSGEDAGITEMNYSAPNRCSIQHRDARALSEIIPPRRKSSLRLRVNGLKSENQVKQSDSGQDFDISRKFATRNSLPSSSMGNHQNPLPGRKARGLDEVVRNMSSVPSYLQRLEKGDNVQEKALNFGVLEWGRLEKWTYLQKQVANRRGGYSPSSSNASSSPFSTVGASSQSTRSSDSPLPQRKQSPILVAQSNYSSDAGRSKHVNEQNRGHLSTANNSEGRKSNGSDMKGIYCGNSQASNAGCSPSTSRGHNTPSFAYDTEKTEISKSREAENFQSCEQSSANLISTENSLEEQCSVIEGMWDDLQETVHKRRISCDSAVLSKERSIEVNHNSFSGTFPTDDIQFANLSPHFPRSCPLPSSSHNDEPASYNPLSNEATNADAEGKHGMHGLFTDSSSRAVKMANKPGPDEAKAPTSLRRELSPHRLIRASINRIKSSSLRESSSGQQIKRASCSYEDDESTCTRGRRSPLRRMLDPLLKSNNRNQFSGPIASLPSHQAEDMNNSNKLPIRDELKLANRSCKPSDASNNPSASQATQSCSPVQGQKDVTSTRQALLKLSWKNGFPLFMFSSHDNNILAATMGKRNITEKNDFECIYTLFNAHEMKKGGIWMSQGNKVKKHNLVYNVIGQMKVSSSNYTKEEFESYSVAREFVLYGAQLVPTGHDQPASPLFNSELAAIVVKIPGENPESSKFDALQNNNCQNSSQTKLPEDKSSSIVVILPSGIHGLSSAGEPSPLVKRWKSGGSCDCGGWDEGCLLTVLTNKAKGRSTYGSAQSFASAGTHRIELFCQGEATVKDHAFTMVAFKEGVYTVEFGPSIALMQAFAICIATLHSWKPTSLAGLHYSVEACSTKDNTFVDRTRMVPRKATGGATTDHPPLSPIGRT